MDVIKTLTGLINDVDNNDIDSLKDLYLELIHLRSELQDINYTRSCETSIADFKVGGEIVYKQLKTAEITDVYDSELQIKDSIGYYKTIGKNDVVEKI